MVPFDILPVTLNCWPCPGVSDTLPGVSTIALNVAGTVIVTALVSAFP